MVEIINRFSLFLLETVHTYPPTHFPLKKLYIGPYFSLKYTPTPNRCHRRTKEYCKNQCIFCEDTNMCVERIETFRTPNPCDKGILTLLRVLKTKSQRLRDVYNIDIVFKQITYLHILNSTIKTNSIHYWYLT